VKPGRLLPLWRGGIGILSLSALTLLVAMAVGEALGWPFLAQPLNR